MNLFPVGGLFLLSLANGEMSTGLSWTMFSTGVVYPEENFSGLFYISRVMPASFVLFWFIIDPIAPYSFWESRLLFSCYNSAFLKECNSFLTLSAFIALVNKKAGESLIICVAMYFHFGKSAAFCSSKSVLPCTSMGQGLSSIVF